jgi:hypothetical protein
MTHDEDDHPHSFLAELAKLLLPILVTQLGEGIREELAHRRELHAPCEHGFPGGRLCSKCFEEREKEKKDE